MDCYTDSLEGFAKELQLPRIISIELTCSSPGPSISSTMSGTSPPGLADETDGDIVYEVDDGDHTTLHFDPVVPWEMQSTPPMAMMALKITSQPWNILGHGSDPNVSATNDMMITVERVTSLFLIRLVALVSHRNAQLETPNPDTPKYSDTSTTVICMDALKWKKPWPKPITSSLIQQLRGFVRSILEKYNEVHYHSFEHAYHVTISLNKLMEMMLMNTSNTSDLSAAEAINNTNFSSSSASINSKAAEKIENRKTYGLKNDPLMALAMLFSALMHDVEHKGVPNRQLVQESHELAILYNDQSVAEQRSLAVAFSELMKDDFQGLRQVMFENQDEYRRFRKAVINIVLATDIASPERTQLVKSKWKEAFGETSESKERKKIKEISRRSVFSNAKASKGSDRTSASLPVDWKGQHGSKPRQIYGDHKGRTMARRGSQGADSTGISSLSMMSDVTIDPSLRAHTHYEATNGRDESLYNIHDDESEEESTVATPESADGLEPNTDLEHDTVGHGNLSVSRAAAASFNVVLSNGVHSISTPVTKGGKSLRRRETPTPSEMMPNMLRRSTDSYVPSSMMTGDTQSTSALSQARAGFSQMGRRFSNPENDKSYAVRLSIRRSLDLTGEAIENYSQSTRTIASSNQPNSNGKGNPPVYDEIHFDPDETDELKASVVMEHLIRAADIGANMQGWQQMKKWSNRLFFELKATHDDNRGEDPQCNWFENQITFLESYIMPLARRLDDMGVFGDTIGPMFARIVQQNRERWVCEGRAETAQIVQEWQISQGEKYRLNRGW